MGDRRTAGRKHRVVEEIAMGGSRFESKVSMGRGRCSQVLRRRRIRTRLALREWKLCRPRGSNERMWKVGTRGRIGIRTWKRWCASLHRTVPTEETNTDHEETSKRRLAKRRAAFFVGYAGSKYRGSQINRERAKGCTVEEILEEAIYKAGFIVENNYQDFGKLRWSRCSRTDKGVHAACNVVSLKIVVEPDAFDVDEEGIEIAERVNRHLPNDIHVSSVKRVSKSFRAREWCKSRTYQYYVPGKILGIDSENPQKERLEKLQEVLDLYVGNRPFHNFTVMKNYVQKPSIEKEEGSGPVETMVFAGEENNSTAGERRSKRAWGSLKWQLEVDPRDKVGSSHYRKITEFVVKEPLRTEAEKYVVPLQVTGVSFMYNQIRIMVGTAIAIAMGAIPIDALPAFFAQPARTRLPIAPPHMLVLAGAEFYPFRQPHTQAHNSLFQGPVGEERSWAFLQEAILPEIFASSDGEEWDEWINLVVETAPSPEELDRFVRTYEEWREERKRIALSRAQEQESTSSPSTAQ